MKIARRKRAQAGTGCLNPGDAKSASRTRLNSFHSELFSVGSALVPPPGKGPAETGPEGGGEGVPTSLRLDTLVVSVSEDLSSLDVDVVVGLGGNGGNGLHDRLLSAQSKGDFRPRKTLSKS